MNHFAFHGNDHIWTKAVEAGSIQDDQYNISWADREIFEFALYWSYMNELWLYSKHTHTEEEVWQWYQQILTDPTNTTLYRIYDDTEEIGFVVIGSKKNCEKGADWYIQDAYILAGYRHRGIMRNFFSKFIEEHPGKYCLFIIDENDIAKEFWDKAFESAGYKPFKIKDKHGMETEYCHLHGWKPKEKNIRQKSS